ncbi:MAG: Gfo/Idh/MocA family oxidoreductase [Chloroflexota bacterium]
MQFALVGASHIHTPGFVKRLSEREDVTVKYVWDPDRDRSNKRAPDLSAEVVSDVDQIWNDDSIEAVVICSETDIHQGLVEAAAQAKKHMFVEKPLGLGAADAYKMADAIEQSGVLFQTGYFQRGIPLNLFAREHIQKGSFGQISRIRHSNCHSGSLRDIFTPEWLWMTDPVRSGCGAFGDLGTHSLDILMWLMGDVDSVTATVDTITAKYGEACDEYGEGLLKFSNGVVGSLAAGWVDAAHPVNILISGTEGHLYAANGQVFFQSEHVEGADGKTPWTDLPEAWPHAFELFLNAVAGEDVQLVGAREAAARSAVMGAMYASTKSQQWESPK